MSQLDPRTRGLDLHSLADEIVDVALANYDLVRQLGAQFGFETSFFWQPVLLLEERKLTPEETTIAAVTRDVYPGLDQLYALTYSRLGVEAQTATDLWLLREVFSGQTSLVFVDPWHVTLEANWAIADEMVRALRTVPGKAAL